MARIARPGAIYDAFVAAQTAEDVNRALGNPIAYVEMIGSGISRAVGYFETKCRDKMRSHQMVF